MKFVWLATCVFAGISVFIFLNDTQRSYAAMVDSMKQHAADNPSLIVEFGGKGGLDLKSSEPVSAGYATRNANDFPDIVLPADSN